MPVKYKKTDRKYPCGTIFLLFFTTGKKAEYCLLNLKNRLSPFDKYYRGAMVSYSQGDGQAQEVAEDAIFTER
jgi:hypothetical protein